MTVGELPVPNVTPITPNNEEYVVRRYSLPKHGRYDAGIDVANGQRRHPPIGIILSLIASILSAISSFIMVSAAVIDEFGEDDLLAHVKRP
jgi:hypothetical protein